MCKLHIYMSGAKLFAMIIIFNIIDIRYYR